MTSHICGRCGRRPSWFGRLCVECVEIEAGAADPADGMPLVRGVRLDALEPVVIFDDHRGKATVPAGLDPTIVNQLRIEIG